MSEKYVKTKTDAPKIKAGVKSKDYVKGLAKNELIKSAVKAKQNTEQERTQKADTEATEKIESRASDTLKGAYNEGKNIICQRVKGYREKKRQNEVSQRVKQPTKSAGDIKTKENYLSSKENKGAHSVNEPRMRIGYEMTGGKDSDSSVVQKKKGGTAKDLRKNHVHKKIRVKHTEDKMEVTPPDAKSVPEAPNIKTKERYVSYARRDATDRYNVPGRVHCDKGYIDKNTPARNKYVKDKHRIINKESSAVKKGSGYKGKIRNGGVVKTQKEITKKAAKEAAKRAEQLTRKAARIAKTAAKAATRVTAKITQLVAQASAKLISALAAMGGWAVLVVVLIVVIIISAIAASPFGVFISEEAAQAESIPISAIVNECNMELSACLTEIEDNTLHNRIVMQGEQAEWKLIISLFAVKLAVGESSEVEDVVVIDDSKKQKLKAVFWDVNEITYRVETIVNDEFVETVLYITITPKTKDEMVSEYGFTRKQKEALETLLDNADGFMDAARSLAISDATAEEMIDNLSESLGESRKEIVEKACSLVGKVTYFWGGKSAAIGWDSRWGKMMLVSAEGSRTTGCMRPFGLDCSGFVTWVFINAGFSETTIGHGVRNQSMKGSRIPLSSAQPGDLAVYDDLSHIGIVVGREPDGDLLVAHCSAGANNVVISASGFDFAVRPYCY